jgi:preprotein translocase subunit SecB
MVAKKGISGSDVQPDIQVAVSLDARKRPADHQYDIISKYRCTSKNKSNGETLFLLEVEYGAIFHVEGVPEEQLHPFLLIECPRLVFPFVRRIISDVTRDGGFPPLNIDTVDFVTLYRQELARRAQAAAGAGHADQLIPFELCGKARPSGALFPYCPIAQLGDKGRMAGGFIFADP